LAACTLGVLAGLIQRTIGRESPVVAAVVLLACSLVTFSPVGGINWTWGTMNANFIVGLATAGMGWQLPGSHGRPRRTVAMLITAPLAAFSFGTGLSLLLVLPPALAALSPVPPSTRRRSAVAAAAWAVATIGVYFTGWHQRTGYPPAVVHWNRLADYGW